MKIDAHQHFWQLDQPFDYGWLDEAANEPIKKNFLPVDLEPQLKEAGIDFSVFVQTQHDLAENRWVLEMAEWNEFIAGVVGWVDLASPEVESQVEEFWRHPKFVGVRHVTQDEPDDDFIVRDEILRGLRVLEKHQVPFDLLFYTKHLRHVPRLADELPNLPMVIDHLSKPKIKTGDIEDWKNDLTAAARFPNVHCKLSGMVTEADWGNWSIEDLRPYAETAIELFGPDRCMFGSDWPVCELAASYQEVVDSAQQLTSGLSDAERARIFGGTAIEFYNLQVPRLPM